MLSLYIATDTLINIALTGQTTGKLVEYLPCCIRRKQGNVAQSYRERKTVMKSGSWPFLIRYNPCIILQKENEKNKRKKEK
jgi:pyruvate/2-oxoacid:ferredoxin oxidoreductase beta subunit